MIMMHRQHNFQAGQAMIEALFILLILMTLMFAIQYSGQLRSHSLSLLGESSYLSFIKSTKKNVLPELSNAELSEQLLQIKEHRLLKVQSNQSDVPYKKSAAHRFFPFSPIQRSSYLQINAGDSFSAQETQNRIARSTSAWSGVANKTHSVIHPQRPFLSKIDAPWGRGLLTTDWLTGWAGQSPRRAEKGRAP
jgi:hypothetical protein